MCSARKWRVVTKSAEHDCRSRRRLTVSCLMTQSAGPPKCVFKQIGAKSAGVGPACTRVWNRSCAELFSKRVFHPRASRFARGAFTLSGNTYVEFGVSATKTGLCGGHVRYLKWNYSFSAKRDKVSRCVYFGYCKALEYYFIRLEGPKES